MTTAEDAQTVLNESFQASGKVDVENGVIRDVLLLSSDSKNRRRYSDPALDDAVTLFASVRVTCEHKKKLDGSPSQREVRETVGWITNPRRKGNRVYGDFNVLRSHPSASLILEIAERNPSLIGFSQAAVGVTRDQGDGSELVVELVEVKSLDLVTDPATTSGLFERFERKERRMSKGKRTTIRKVVQSLPRSTPGRKTLMEMVGSDALSAEVDAASLEDMSPEDQAKMSLKEAVMSIIDGDGSVDEIVAALLELLSPADVSEEDSTEEEPVMEAEGEGGDTEEPAVEEEKPVSESVNRELLRDLQELRKQNAKQAGQIKALMESNAKAKEDAEVRDLFESAGVTPTARDLRMAKALPKSERGEFVDQLKELHESRELEGVVVRSSGGSGGGSREKFSKDGFLAGLKRKQ